MTRAELKRLSRWVSIILVGLVIAIGLICAYGTEKTVTTTIVRIEKEENPNEDWVRNKYHVYTEDGEYDNVASFFRWKYNVDELREEMREGGRYKLYISGIRSPFFKTVPNIYKVEEVQ